MGNSNFHGGLVIPGGVYYNLTVSGGLVSGGTLKVTNLKASGGATISGDLIALGGITISGGITVSGTVQAPHLKISGGGVFNDMGCSQVRVSGGAQGGRYRVPLIECFRGP